MAAEEEGLTFELSRQGGCTEMDTEQKPPADAVGSSEGLGLAAEARNTTVLGLNDLDKHTDLISRLQDEADLCRNDGATDIAALLDEAVAALQAPRPEVAGDGSEAMQLSWVPLNRRNLDWHAHATVQLRAMHVALSAAQKTPRDPLEIEELWDEAHELLEQGGQHGPEVHELFARLIERAHGIGV